jgi:hypothetical protein
MIRKKAQDGLRFGKSLNRGIHQVSNPPST